MNTLSQWKKKKKIKEEEIILALWADVKPAQSNHENEALE